MSRRKGSWWALQRGSFRFAVRVSGSPRVVPGSSVWWTDDQAERCGVVSADPRPVPVVDLSGLMSLPARPITGAQWVLASADSATPWAFASDVQPAVIPGEAREQPVPTLPTDAARRLVTTAITSGGVSYLVVDPVRATDFDASEERGGVVTESRISSRLAHLTAPIERPDVLPSLLVVRVDSMWWGLRAESVQAVVPIRHVTPLPGAEPIVWGLTTILGRVNVVVDPARVLDLPSPKPPCWLAEIRAKGAKWGLAAAQEWSVLSGSEVTALADYTRLPGPPGLFGSSVRHEHDTIFVFSIDRLTELAAGGGTRRAS